MAIYGLLLLILLVSATLAQNFYMCGEDEPCLCDETGKIVGCESSIQQYLNPKSRKRSSRSRKRFSGRIVGGTDVEILKHPYMLGLETNGRLYCGATIIGSRWAVTAGHCVTPSLLGTIKLRALTDRLETGGHTFGITGYIPHPEYNDDTQENDIAILRVDHSFSETDSRLAAINLPQPNEELPVGTMVTVIGFGHTQENGQKSEHLKRVMVPITSSEHCNARFDGEINSRLMLCAGPREGGKDACQADSGGPLVYNNTLYGIVSFGRGCGMTDVPGVYTKVSAQRQWIEQVTGL